MSKNDTAAKGKKVQEVQATFREIGRGCYAYCVEGGVNTGVIVGDTGVLIVDAQPTTEGAERLLEEIGKITDKPIKHVVLTHYHAESTQGASVFGAGEILVSDLTKRLLDERGGSDRSSVPVRYPELFEGGKHVPAPFRPTMTFASSMSVDLGRREIRIMHLGRGHTMGDVVVWVPGSRVLFAGDLVGNEVACYCGDAHLGDWPRALNRIVAFRPQALLPGRGKAVVGADRIVEAISATKNFVGLLRDTAATSVETGKGLQGTFLAVKDAMDPLFSTLRDYERTLLFNVARAYDEAHGIDIPEIWTAERDRALAAALKDVATQAAKKQEPQQAPAREEAAPQEEGDDVLALSSKDIAPEDAAKPQEAEGKAAAKVVEQSDT